MQITLHQFEQIDGLMSSILRMGPFETCADPRGYIRASNVLLDKLVDAFGLAFVDTYADALECAAAVVAAALLNPACVVDEVAL
ncbi:hypothetical protein UFOVP152_39 [uncultured Caudovirales phage]|uniref:Uncharacterized protein n=1 Tax=uncultured Caudovirales phage TaxID=2100421 RepID=A0A6J7W8E1_9CAUD|nr:hypothetical protein UFOVP152_39 [uncultured Caudovirales phage]